MIPIRIGFICRTYIDYSKRLGPSELFAIPSVLVMQPKTCSIDWTYVESFLDKKDVSTPPKDVEFDHVRCMSFIAVNETNML